MENQLNLNDKTRIILKYLIRACDVVICLQRKKWYGWKTVAWMYPSVVEDKSCQQIKEYLFWEESYKTRTNEVIGKEIMSKCKVEFEAVEK